MSKKAEDFVMKSIIIGVWIFVSLFVFFLGGNILALVIIYLFYGFLIWTVAGINETKGILVVLWLPTLLSERLRDKWFD